MPDTPSQTTLPDLLDITRLAEHLGVEPRHIRRLVHEKRIPYIKWGHLIRFDPTDIAEWLNNNRRPPSHG
ncbi:MAG TPA: helix-turn-helix domain-containing protein [Acidimicrobiales bacterium]|nr:helix-turn-helix domain-containing protein [Acidimicrobiales bacterium]